ncbi:putative benzoate 4-monooxygenase cytochrome P450 [Aspergillus taichungensis]|uniref:Putative benzoate 4-monooxygenase cytochrome P450 n=1 Tax=Aspergillus taichungensis TaxID=482145 RepID=A0A2J5IAF2_9EURO|nr:putative benzoate 4-monooxygenase cytochrome P450 [Aspergillus taichungensis]
MVSSIFAETFERLVAYSPWLLGCIVLLHFGRTYARLRHIPGPIGASLSNLSRLSWVWSRRAHVKHINLHRQYGPLVRFGPNMVSVADPREVPNIYGFSGKYKKSRFYQVILPMSQGRILPGLFATQDEDIHRMLKKPIASIYSMSNLVSFEPLVDRTIHCFFEQLDSRFARAGQTLDFGAWLQMFAFDVIGEITFSRRLGFLEKGEDIDHIMSDIWKYFQYVAPVGQMPWIDSLWVKNPWISRLRKPSWSPMGDFTTARQTERMKLMNNPSAETTQVNDRDFLSRFIAAMGKDRSIPQWALLAWAQSNITAGSDTTAIMLRTIFYNLLRHPDTMTRLMDELRTAAQKGELSPTVSWKQSRQLPYLDACIKEAGRIHPPFGLPLERIVPPGGATISGQYLPQGTIVGMNAWVVHRDRAVFGADADQWRPDRWLDRDEVTLRTMESSLLTFGHGHRTCIGKNISHLEVYKLVPTLLQAYDIRLQDPSKEWRVENRWFVPQFDFHVTMKRRGQL